MRPTDERAQSPQPPADPRAAEIAAIAQGIIEGSVGITEGARALSKLATQPDLEQDADLRKAIGMDSETDRFPLGDVRDRWNPDALIRVDLEREAVEAKHSGWFLEACHNLVERYGASERTA